VKHLVSTGETLRFNGQNTSFRLAKRSLHHYISTTYTHSSAICRSEEFHGRYEMKARRTCKQEKEDRRGWERRKYTAMGKNFFHCANIHSYLPQISDKRLILYRAIISSGP
jgi:hypothetical protein